ncbi:MAG TPA: hypothetical protein VEV16_10405 [Daejeonella sp.]|nr:hypothetical protein [Daejeonella sp.]
MENAEQQPRKNSNKIYFLVAVILALLGTNAYLFFKEKKSSERVITISDEKSRMQTEIDKIEAELDNSNSANLKLSTQMQQEQEQARQKITELRTQLKAGKLTQAQLAKAQEDIKQLRGFVSKYTQEIEDLKQQNAALTTERNTLRSTVDSVSTQATTLTKANEELSGKVKVASALKTASIAFTPLKIKNSGKETDVTRAHTTQKIRVNFTVANNPIAEKGMHDIFMRIIDPSGNLIISNAGGMFTSDDEELQYTYKTAIEFSNDGKIYTIDWTNPSSFQKGTYTVVLYADGYTMGKGTFTLK